MIDELPQPFSSREKKEYINYSVQSARADDLPEITKLLDETPQSDNWDLSFKQFVVAKEQDRVIGCVRVKELSSDCLELASLAVVPEYRRQGVGSTLIQMLLQKESRRPLYLLCSKAREQFYYKNGFHAIAIEELPYALLQEYQRITSLPFAKNMEVLPMMIDNE